MLSFMMNENCYNWESNEIDRNTDIYEHLRSSSLLMTLFSAGCLFSLDYIRPSLYYYVRLRLMLVATHHPPGRLILLN